MKNVLAFLILFTVFSCKKDSDKKDLIAKSWSLSSINIIASDGTSTLLNLNTCDAGRTWTFQKDGTYLDEPSPSCIQSGFDDTIRGVWTLSNNNLKIQFPNPGAGFLEIEYKIIQLTSVQLVVRRHRPLDGRGGSGGGGFGTSTNEVQYEFAAR